MQEKKPDPLDVDLYLFEVVQGKSSFNSKGSVFYFKHPTIIESFKEKKIFFDSINQAKIIGLNTKEELVQSAISAKIWSLAEEEEIKSLKWQFDKTKEAIKKITDPLQKFSIEKNLEDIKSQIETKEKKREKLTKWSAESYAENQKWDNFIKSYFYEDELCTIKADLTKLNLNDAFGKVSFLHNDDLNLYAAYDYHFFGLFSIFNKSPESIFGVKTMDLTLYQKNLLSQANFLYQKIKNHSMPDHVYNDPRKILNFKDDQKNKNVTDGVKDLKLKHAAKKGNLSAEDYLK